MASTVILKKTVSSLIYPRQERFRYKLGATTGDIHITCGALETRAVWIRPEAIDYVLVATLIDQLGCHFLLKWPGKQAVIATTLQFAQHRRNGLRVIRNVMRVIRNVLRVIRNVMRVVRNVIKERRRAQSCKKFLLVWEGGCAPLKFKLQQK